MAPEPDMAVLSYRVGELETGAKSFRRDLNDFRRDLDIQHDTLAVHTEQIAGDGGLQNSIRLVRAEIGSLRVAFYGLTTAIVVGTFALIGAIATHAV